LFSGGGEKSPNLIIKNSTSQSAHQTNIAITINSSNTVTSIKEQKKNKRKSTGNTPTFNKSGNKIDPSNKFGAKKERNKS